MLYFENKKKPFHISHLNEIQWNKRVFYPIWFWVAFDFYEVQLLYHFLSVTAKNYWHLNEFIGSIFFSIPLFTFCAAGPYPLTCNRCVFSWINQLNWQMAKYLCCTYIPGWQFYFILYFHFCTTIIWMIYAIEWKMQTTKLQVWLKKCHCFDRLETEIRHEQTNSSTEDIKCICK